MPEALSSPVRGPMLESFLVLSRILTGVENLDAEQAPEFSRIPRPLTSKQ